MKKKRHAKRLGPGYYEYRGFELTKYGPFWFVATKGEILDRVDSKKEAMETVDWICLRDARDEERS